MGLTLRFRHLTSLKANSARGHRTELHRTGQAWVVDTSAEPVYSADRRAFDATTCTSAGGLNVTI